jgi:hypothetical protein
MRHVMLVPFVGLVLPVLAGGPFALAQSPPTPRDVLTDLRAKPSLTEEDRGTIRAWIEERLVAVAEASESTERATAELRQAPSEAGPAFREAYAGILTDAVRQRFRTAPAGGAARMIALLSALNEPQTHPVLLEAIRDERSGVRAAAAVGLRNLRAKLSGLGGAYVSDTFAALREAGRRESSAPVLRTIYQALDYPETVPNPPDPRANVGALLDVLEARAELYASGSLTAEGAETTGLRAVMDFRKLLTEDDRKRLLTCLGRMLRYAVARYANDRLYLVRDRVGSPAAIELRNNTELLIEECEALLAELLAPAKAPSIAATLRNIKSDSDRVNMKLEMNKWAELVERAVGQRFYMDESTDAEPPGG